MPPHKHKKKVRVQKKPSTTSTPIKIILPTKATRATLKLEDQVILLAGPPNVGKTTFASKFPDPLFILTQPGTNFLVTRDQMVRTWEEFVASVDALEEAILDDPSFCSTVVVDVIDELYILCNKYICDKLHVDHPSEVGYAKGWHALSEEWLTQIQRLVTLPVGVVFLGHVKEKEVEIDGVEDTQLMPSMRPAAYATINSFADFCMVVDIRTSFVEKRVKVSGQKKKQKRLVPETKRVLCLRGKNNGGFGNRTPDMPQEIEFDYEVFRETFDTYVKKHVKAV